MTKLRVYDEWSGNEKGTPEDPTRCIVAVPSWSGWHSPQCRRKRGFGPEGLYCKQHAKIEERRLRFAKEYGP